MPFDAVLPSYQDAVGTKGNWVSLAAPYVATADYANLCLVSRRFNDVFTPLLWRDPLVTIRKLGLDPADGSFCTAPFRPKCPSVGLPPLLAPILPTCIPSLVFPGSKIRIENGVKKKSEPVFQKMHRCALG